MKLFFLQVHFTIGNPPMPFITERRILEEADTYNNSPGCGITVSVMELFTWNMEILQSFSEIIEELVLIANHCFILDIKFCLFLLGTEEECWSFSMAVNVFLHVLLIVNYIWPSGRSSGNVFNTNIWIRILPTIVSGEGLLHIWLVPLYKALNGHD